MSTDQGTVVDSFNQTDTSGAPTPNRTSLDSGEGNYQHQYNQHSQEQSHIKYDLHGNALLTTIKEDNSSLEETKFGCGSIRRHKTSEDQFGYTGVPDLTKVPPTEDEQIKQICHVIAIERQNNGRSCSDDDYLRELKKPVEIIRAELRDREQRDELNQEQSSLLIKVTMLYQVTVFEVKPQIFPSSHSSLKSFGPVNAPEISQKSMLSIDDLAGKHLHSTASIIQSSAADDQSKSPSFVGADPSDLRLRAFTSLPDFAGEEEKEISKQDMSRSQTQNNFVSPLDVRQAIDKLVTGDSELKPSQDDDQNELLFKGDDCRSENLNQEEMQQAAHRQGLLSSQCEAAGQERISILKDSTNQEEEKAEPGANEDDRGSVKTKEEMEFDSKDYQEDCERSPTTDAGNAILTNGSSEELGYTSEGKSKQDTIVEVDSREEESRDLTLEFMRLSSSQHARHHLHISGNVDKQIDPDLDLKLLEKSMCRNSTSDMTHLISQVKHINLDEESQNSSTYAPKSKQQLSMMSQSAVSESSMADISMASVSMGDFDTTNMAGAGDDSESMSGESGTEVVKVSTSKTTKKGGSKKHTRQISNTTLGSYAQIATKLDQLTEVDDDEDEALQ